MYVFGSPYKSGCTKHGCIRGLYKSGFVLGTSIICIVVYHVKSGFAVMLITCDGRFQKHTGIAAAISSVHSSGVVAPGWSSK